MYLDYFTLTKTLPEVLYAINVGKFRFPMGHKLKYMGDVVVNYKFEF